MACGPGREPKSRRFSRSLRASSRKRYGILDSPEKLFPESLAASQSGVTARTTSKLDCELEALWESHDGSQQLRGPN